MDQLLASGAYRSRIVDTQIERYLRLFGAIEISGTKWCGKTWAAMAHGSSITYVDRGANLQIVQADPAYALTGKYPHVIDEWQRVPQVWDTVRHAVDDAAGEKGLWILTGSSTPLKPGERAHSGAGRIGRIRMSPMTLAETGESKASVSLAALFEGEFVAAQCPDGLVGLSDIACRGGWPEATSLSAEDAQIIVREYLGLIFDESVPRFDGDTLTARRLATSLARNLGQSPTAKTLAADIFALPQGAEATEAQLKDVYRHLEILKRIYLIDEVPGWVPAARSPLRMRTKPKLYFADPSLPVGLLGRDPFSLLQDWQTFGLVFENLVIRDLGVYARALPNVSDKPLKYYRDDAGLEVDAIIERADGSWAAIEVKLSQEKVEAGAKNLLRLRNKLLKDELSRTPAPVFMAVVTGIGEAPYRRADGIYVIPIRSLTA